MVKVPGEGSSLSAALECRDSLAFRVQRFAGVTLLQKKLMRLLVAVALFSIATIATTATAPRPLTKTPLPTRQTLEFLKSLKKF